jgi:hypothetical protein
MQNFCFLAAACAYLFRHQTVVAGNPPNYQICQNHIYVPMVFNLWAGDPGGGGLLQSYCKGSANPYVHHTFSFHSLFGFSKTCDVNNGFCDNGCVFLMLHLWPVEFFLAFSFLMK